MRQSGSRNILRVVNVGGSSTLGGSPYWRILNIGIHSSCKVSENPPTLLQAAIKLSTQSSLETVMVNFSRFCGQGHSSTLSKDRGSEELQGTGEFTNCNTRRVLIFRRSWNVQACALSNVSHLILESIMLRQRSRGNALGRHSMKAPSIVVSNKLRARRALNDIPSLSFSTELDTRRCSNGASGEVLFQGKQFTNFMAGKGRPEKWRDILVKFDAQVRFRNVKLA